MGSQGTTKGTKRKMSGRWKDPSDFLLDFMRSYQDLAFFTRIQDGILRDNKRDKKKMSGRWKNPSDFLLDFMKSYQDFTFSIRIQDGAPRGN